MAQQQIQVDAPAAVAPQAPAVEPLLAVSVPDPCDEAKLPLGGQSWGRGEVFVRTRHPSLAIQAQATRGQHQMNMRIPFQITSKRVNYSNDARQEKVLSPTSLDPFPTLAPHGLWLSRRQTQYRIRRATQ